MRTYWCERGNVWLRYSISVCAKIWVLGTPWCWIRPLLRSSHMSNYHSGVIHFKTILSGFMSMPILFRIHIDLIQNINEQWEMIRLKEIFIQCFSLILFCKNFCFLVFYNRIYIELIYDYSIIYIFIEFIFIWTIYRLVII